MSDAEDKKKVEVEEAEKKVAVAKDEVADAEKKVAVAKDEVADAEKKVAEAKDEVAKEEAKKCAERAQKYADYAMDCFGNAIVGLRIAQNVLSSVVNGKCPVPLIDNPSIHTHPFHL